ncbi:MAG: hypothetical protein C0176_00630 [Mesoaciditoga sp.]|uniref:hypothetical protein n=1 Tax=Athalassotoga sp. TaxID=2022597 RepID=UPI000CC06521|nr:MAG: hypothetical protein C0185_01675 [Mesoaciditoga sp.]PMP80851.1 MAG: hypothetical protein C0176_00630 [Mesoaciditoga sp.]HEU24145.1 hypothetical protein [Mesoaciditoga lauensis]
MKSVDEFVKNLSTFFTRDSVPRFLIRVENDLYRREIISSLFKIVEKSNPYYDTFEVEREEYVSIDTVRKIRSFLSYPPSNASRKYVIIDEMSLLTPEASSALLKIVEEPPDYAVFLAFSSNIDSIFSTLKSRFFIFTGFFRMDEFVESLNLHDSREIDLLKSNPELVDLYKKAPEEIKNIISLMEKDILDFESFKEKGALLADFERVLLLVNFKNINAYFDRLNDFLSKDRSLSILFDASLILSEDLIIFHNTNLWKSLNRKSYIAYYIKMKAPLREFVERLSRIKRENVNMDVNIFWLLLNFSILKKV